MTESLELVITRVFDAPRELVYQAFLDPDQLSQWFGPAGWSVPRATVDIEARVGGHQRFTMVNDDDPSMTSTVDAVFTELIPGELLVGTEQALISDGTHHGPMYLRIELYDEGGKTRMVLRQGPYTELLEGMAREGWQGSFGKLDALLERVRSEG